MPGGHDQTLKPFLWRAENLYPSREIVSRTHEGIERYGYREYADRARALSAALENDVEMGERVATFCWNHHRHFETYFGVPNIGAQLHTINPLLPDEHIGYIVDNADDQVIFVDPSLLEKLEGAQNPDEFGGVERYVVMGSDVPDTSLEPVVDYESYLGDSDGYSWPEVSEDQPAGMCYTSGTTGKPKGVEYTQKMLWAHTMATLTPQANNISDEEVVMPVVPMFHVNAWGIPFTCTAAGAKQVYPGPAPEPGDLVSLIENEGVTFSAGVPTVWIGLLEYLDEHGGDISSLERVVVGGAAAPESIMRGFEEYGVEVVHAWGMTEMTPIGTVSHMKHGVPRDEETRYDKKKKQGLVVPGLEFRVVDEDGEEVEWNGEDFGELWVRGPWVTQEYFKRPDANQEDFEGSWLKTGDVVSVDSDGYIKIVDRTKDVIKSGGEWISSVELENTLMSHDGVAEATVIGVPSERWQERPVAFVVKSGGLDEDALRDELDDLVRDGFPEWWSPDEVVFVEEIPKTATGKFDKKVLRDEYSDEELVEGKAPEDAAPED